MDYSVIFTLNAILPYFSPVPVTSDNKIWIADHSSSSVVFSNGAAMLNLSQYYNYSKE
jgi:hypothetical protein